MKNPIDPQTLSNIEAFRNQPVPAGQNPDI